MTLSFAAFRIPAHFADAAPDDGAAGVAVDADVVPWSEYRFVATVTDSSTPASLIRDALLAQGWDKLDLYFDPGARAGAGFPAQLAASTPGGLVVCGQGTWVGTRQTLSRILCGAGVLIYDAAWPANSAPPPLPTPTPPPPDPSPPSPFGGAGPAAFVAAASALAGVGAHHEPEKYLGIVMGPADRDRNYFMHATSCALWARGLWRVSGVDHAILRAPYRVGAAVADCLAIARAKAAWVVAGGPDGPRPKPGAVARLNTPGTNDDHMVPIFGVRGPWTFSTSEGGQQSPRGVQPVEYAETGGFVRTWAFRNGILYASATSTKRVMGWSDPDLMYRPDVTPSAPPGPGPGPSPAPPAPPAPVAGSSSGGRDLVAIAAMAALFFFSTRGA